MCAFTHLSIAVLTVAESLGGTKKDMTQNRYCLNNWETPLKASELRDFKTCDGLCKLKGCDATSNKHGHLHDLEVLANKFNE
jgi:hypothetical protein